MKGNAKVIECLNEALTGELTAINQYWIHAMMCKNWGYLKLAEDLKAESIGEMKHADALINRVLFLDGVPNVQRYGKIIVGTTVQEQIENDLKLELDAIKVLTNGINVAVEANDYGSKELMEVILKDEEEHVDHLEAQLHIIQEVGIQNYLAQHIHNGKGNEAGHM